MLKSGNINKIFSESKKLKKWFTFPAVPFLYPLTIFIEINNSLNLNFSESNFISHDVHDKPNHHVNPLH